MTGRLLCTLGFIAACTLLPSLAEAKAARSLRAELRQPPAAAPQALPAPAVSPSHLAPPCCPDRCITYKHHRPGRKVCCDCGPSIQIVLPVEDPCVCGCMVPVCVCLPGCCTDAPKVCCHKGVFGRSVVEYEWCCGYRVKVVFDRHGDVVVHTFGA